MKVKNIVYEQNGNISKGIENYKEILEMKSAQLKLKNSLEYSKDLRRESKKL